MAIPKFLKMLSGRVQEAVMTALEVTDTLGYVPREKLSAARTYYVRTDGNDSNTGLVNNSGGAFLTIQKAIDVASNIDNSGYEITIQVADGTYSSGTITLKSFVGSGGISIVGNTTTPSNCYIDNSATAGNHCFYAASVIGVWSVSGFKLKPGSSGTALYALGSPTRLNFAAIDFAAANRHIFSWMGALIAGLGNYSISGSATYHAYVGYSAILTANGVTVTLSGTPAFTAFVNAVYLGTVSLGANTYNGSATGTRYLASMNGAISTNSAGATYFPGNASGSTSTGGQYA
jgi:hypothetical protein